MFQSKKEAVDGQRLQYSQERVQVLLTVGNQILKTHNDTE
jgi:hypothetical protein